MNKARIRQRGVAWAAAMATLLASPAAMAQALSVQTSVSEATVTVGDVVTLQVTVTAKVTDPIKLTLPETPAGLIELGRQQRQSQSLTFSSGTQSVIIQQIYSLNYQAERPGRFTVGGASARAGRHKARSSPVTIRVLGQQQAAAPATAAIANDVAPPDASEGTFFLRYRVDKAKPYLGQAVLLDLEIIKGPGERFQVEQIDAFPEIEGFWTEVIETAQTLRARKITVNGKQYVSYRRWRAVLYPLRAGAHVIPNVSTTLVKGGSLFRAGQRLRRTTKGVKLEVQPLPSEGRPSDFVSTNVGRYKLTASVDHKRVKAGKAVLYTLRLSGAGNINAVRLPTIDRIPGFRVFAPTYRDDIKASAKGITGTKEAEYLLMPEKGGRLTIPPVSMWTFDPDAGRYRRLATKKISVRVDGTPDPVTAPEAPPPPSAQAGAGGDKLALRPLRFTSALGSTAAPPWRYVWFWALLLLPALGSGATAAWRYKAQRATNASPKSVQRTAVKKAKADLDAARADVEQGALTDAYAKIAEALRGCGSQMLGLSIQGLTLDVVAEEAGARGLSEDDAKDLVRLLEAAEYARYAPSQLTGAAAQSDIYRAEQLIVAFSQLSGEDR